VTFLTTWVKRPDANDYKKLCHVIKYLRGTPDLALTLEADNAHIILNGGLEADNANIIKWWVDASFAVHKDMHSHMGGTLSHGKGSLYAATMPQKINTKSLTEAELVAVGAMSCHDRNLGSLGSFTPE
jgi:hypothetical protein